MAKRQIQVGSTSVILEVFFQDSSSATGGGLAGLTYTTGGLTCYYHRDTASASVAVSLAPMTLGTFASSGFVVVDGTNMPGMYAFSPPDAAFASGATSVTFYFQGASNLAATPIEIELTATNNQDGVNGGMTALPKTACTTNDSLITSGTGSDQLSVSSGLVNVGKINNVSTSNVTTVSAIQGTTLALTFDGNNLVKVDLEDIKGTGVSASTAQIGVNVVNIAGTASAGTAGYVGIDWSAVHAPTSTVGLTQTTVGTLTTYTGNTLQTGDSYARIGAAGAGLTNIVLPSGGLANVTAWTVAITGNITGNLSGSVGSVTGAVGSVTGAVGSVTGAVGSVTAAVTVSGDFSATMKTSIVTAVWDQATSGHTSSGTFGAAVVAAGSSGDPWATSLPGSYGAGTAGNIVGNNLNATITSRMATYTQPTGFLAATFPTTVSNYAGGAVASVTAGVTVTTNNDKTGYSLTVTPPTAAAIATAIWTDSTHGDFTTASSPGYILQTQLGGVFTSSTSSVFNSFALVNAPAAPTAIAVAAAVWRDAVAGDFQVSGSIGASLGGAFTALGTPVYSTPALANAPSGGSGPTVQQIAAAVWQDATAGDFSVAGSIGLSFATAFGSLGSGVYTIAALANAPSGTGSSPAVIAAAVWSTLVPGAFTAGMAGYSLGLITQITNPNAISTGTVISSPTPYCSPYLFLYFYDWRTVGRLLVDGGPTFDPTKSSATAVAAMPVLTSLLLEMTGTLEMDCLAGGRYLPSDLLALQTPTMTGGGMALAGMIADLTMWRVVRRRPDLSIEMPSQCEQVFKELERLRTGEAIFGLQETADAGRMRVVRQTAAEAWQRRGVVVQNSRLFGRRANETDP